MAFLGSLISKKNLWIVASFFGVFLVACSWDGEYSYDLKDQALSEGTLENGFRYYLYPNSFPKDIIELALIVRSGSLVEEDSQRGIAHFLEHMAFNGTKSFPKNELVRFLESQGLRFGADLNARTSFESTIYTLRVEASKPEALNTALNVLREWASEISFLEEDIHHERTIILEERRLRGLGHRLLEAIYPFLFPYSRYIQRFPIGLEEGIKNWKRHDLMEFYQHWYQASNMALVVVGDYGQADPLHLRIKDLFSSLESQMPSQVDFSTSSSLEESDGKNFLYKTIADKDISSSSWVIYYPLEQDFMRELNRKNVTAQIFLSLWTRRMNEWQELHGWVSSTSIDLLSLEDQKPYLALDISLYDEKLSDGFQSFWIEAKRILDHGFSEEELRWVLDQRASSMDLIYQNREKRPSSSLREAIISYDLEGIDLLDPQELYRADAFYRDSVRLEDIQQFTREIFPSLFPKTASWVFLYSPEKSSAWTQTAVAEMITVVEMSKTSPYQWVPLADDFLRETFIEKIKEAPLEDEIFIESSGFHHWRVASNGARVFFKPSTLQPGLFSLDAISPGGFFVEDQERYRYDAFGDFFLNHAAGLASWKPSELKKRLEERNIAWNVAITHTQERFTLTAPRVAAKLAFEVLYAFFEDLHLDEDLFVQGKMNLENSIKTQDTRTRDVFRQLKLDSVYESSPYTDMFRLDEIQRFQREDQEKLWKRRFSGAEDFFFIIVGDLDLEEAKNLTRRYIASIPRGLPQEDLPQWRLKEQSQPTLVTRSLDPEPKASVSIAYGASFSSWDPLRSLSLNVLALMLESVLIEEIRENFGDVYSISSQIEEDVYFNETRAFLRISFVTDPQKVHVVESRITEVLHRLREQGFQEERLRYSKEYLSKTSKQAEELNSFWRSWLAKRLLYQHDWKNYSSFDVLKEGLHLDDLKHLFDQSFHFERPYRAILFPESYQENP